MSKELDLDEMVDMAVERALSHSKSIDELMAMIEKRDAHIAALESRLAAGEPVAWRFNWSHIEGHEEETSEWASMPFSDPLKNRCGANIEYAYLAQPPAAQVPDGWKLVPINATSTMRYAFETARESLIKQHTFSGSIPTTYQSFNAGYAAMLAAAPKP